MKLSDICAVMEAYAPPMLAEQWDNVGLLVGDPAREIQSILIALDVTEAVIEEAVRIGADLIITHHPLIFKPITAITADDPLGRKIIRLIGHRIAVYAAHTNLDMADGGTNDVLFERLHLEDKQKMPGAEAGCPGKTGVLAEKMSLGAFAGLVKERLGLSHVIVTGDTGRMIGKVGVCTGSGGQYIQNAAEAGCDAYVTGDIRYHSAQQAEEFGICLIDATHYATEIIIVQSLLDMLTKKGLRCAASQVDGQPFHVL